MQRGRIKTQNKTQVKILPGLAIQNALGERTFSFCQYRRLKVKQKQ